MISNKIVKSNKTLYGNYKVYHPKGHLMFYCDKKKYNWYLSRDLAFVLPDEEKSIKLTFEPKGDGEMPQFLTSQRENICVVTGTSDYLTKHHVIPTQYRQYFPEVYKSKNSNDVVAMCDEEHQKYERIADVYKNELINLYITPEEFEYNRMLEYITKISNTLNLYEHLIPSDRVADLYNRLDKFLNKLGVVIDEVKDLDTININELIVERAGVEKLIIDWKNHFIQHANPQFLPDWWDPDFIKIIDIR